MSTARFRNYLDNPASFPEGRINPEVVGGTTEAQDMARYARRVSPAPGAHLDLVFSAHQRAVRDDPEQGKRCPTGAERTLLSVLDKAPETTLRVLT